MNDAEYRTDVFLLNSIIGVVVVDVELGKEI